MSRSETLKLWDGALAAWDGQRESEALQLLGQIKDPSSRILFNFGTAHMCSGDYSQALQYFLQCITKDEHFALAYFQEGVALYKLKRYSEAQLKFQKSDELLRGKHFIDYSQLGLRYKLYKCECQLNFAICLHKLGNSNGAHEIMESARSCTAERRHQLITDNLDALQTQGELTLLEVPREAMFRPPKQMIANLPKKNYLGEAKVIAAATSEEAEFSGFSGPRRVEEGQVTEGVIQAPLSPKLKKISIDSALASVSLLGRGPVIGYSSPPDRPPPTPPNRNRTAPTHSNSEPGEAEINEALKQVAARQSLMKHEPLNRKKSASVPNSPRSSVGNITPPELPTKPPTSGKPDWKSKTNGERVSALSSKFKTLVTVTIHCKDTVAVQVPSGCDVSDLRERAATAVNVDKNKYDLWFRRPEGDSMVRISRNDQLKSLWPKDSLRFWLCSK